MAQQRVKCFVGLTFRLGKTKFRLLKTDMKVLAALRRIRQARPPHPKLTWLLRHRQDIRRIVECRRRATLTMAALATRDIHTIRLALWLRGKCGGVLGAPELLRRAQQSHLEIQKQTARAFQKMGAWAQLRKLAENQELAEAAPRFLRQPPAKSFESRLSHYLEKVQPRKISTRIRPVETSFGNRHGKGKPAKPLWVIRLVLDRIRLLVSAKHSVDRLPKEYQESLPDFDS